MRNFLIGMGADEAPIFIYMKMKMNITDIRNFVEEYVANHGEALGIFVVDVSVDGDNNVVVSLDSEGGVDLDFCGALTRGFGERFNQDEYDYSLEVGSCGLTSPLRMPRQYEVRRGEKVEVLTTDGRKLKGVLAASDESGFELTEKRMVKAEGEKRKHEEEVTTRLLYTEVKYTKPIIEV